MWGLSYVDRPVTARGALPPDVAAEIDRRVATVCAALLDSPDGLPAVEVDDMVRVAFLSCGWAALDRETGHVQLTGVGRPMAERLAGRRKPRRVFPPK